MNDSARLDKHDELIERLMEEVGNLKKQVERLEKQHIHHQDVYQAGSTGEPVFFQLEM